MPDTDYIEKATAPVIGVALHTFVILSSPLWAESLYLTDNTIGIDIGGTVYQPYEMQYVQSSSDVKSEGAGQLIIDDIARQLIAVLRGSTDDVFIEIFSAFSDDVNHITTGPFNYKVSTLTATDYQITLVLSRDTIFKNKLSGFRVDDTDFPGIFL